MKLKPNELIEKITQSIITALEESLIHSESSINWKRILKSERLPVNYETKKAYSGINVFQLWEERFNNQFSSNKWVTYKQAQKLGLILKKEQKGTPIIRYGTYAKEKLNSAGETIINPETGEVIQETKGFLRVYFVFNLAQMENCPEEEIIYPKPDEADLIPDNQLQRAKEIFEHSGAKTTLGYTRAFYSPMYDQIFMPGKNQFRRDEEFYAVYFHELTHWVGGTKRLNRNMEYHKKRGRAFEEIIAELGAAFLGAEANIYDSFFRQCHARYIKGWLTHLRNDPKYLLSAASQASKAMEFILASVEANKQPLIAEEEAA